TGAQEDGLPRERAGRCDQLLHGEQHRERPEEQHAVQRSPAKRPAVVAGGVATGEIETTDRAARREHGDRPEDDEDRETGDGTEVRERDPETAARVREQEQREADRGRVERAEDPTGRDHPWASTSASATIAARSPEV